MPYYNIAVDIFIKKYGDKSVGFFKLNSMTGREFNWKYGVKGVPKLLAIRNGELLATYQGDKHKPE